MKLSSRTFRRSIRSAALCAGLALPVVMAAADTVYVKSGAKGFGLPNVTVNKIAKNDIGDEVVYYTTENGQVLTKPLADIIRLDVDGEPVFSKAEKEYMDGDLTAAGADYRKAMASTSKDWVKHRADIRLVDISAKTGDFAGAVTGFVEMARNDPAAAEKQKPAISGAKPDQLDAAIAAVQRGLGGSKNETQLVLLPFLANLQTQKGDDKGAAQTLARLQKMNPGAAPNRNATPAENAVDADSRMNAKQAEANLSLSSATKAFTDKQYAVAIKTIIDHKASFVDPEKQAQALYLIAQAKEATATTPDALADAAVAYMRVVANFKLQPNSPAADALYKTATIDEKLQKPSDALLIYKQVINEFKETKAAQDAQAAVARIQASRG